MATRFGVGVLGATGYIGTAYRREIRQTPADARMIALGARRHELLAAAGIDDEAQLVTNDWRQVVEHPAVNLILVCTPDALHYEAVMECAARGKHLVCEKPIAMDAKQGRQMLAAVRAAGIAHFVPFWTRYVPVCVRARELVRQGVLGDVRAVIYRWHNPRPMTMPLTWRDDAKLSSAGSLADVGSHAYDTLRWMLGCEAIKVLAHADVIAAPKPQCGTVNLSEALSWLPTHPDDDSVTRAKGTANDFAAITFTLDNGAVGNMLLSHAPYLRKGLAPELELHGTRASLAIHRLRSTITLITNGEELAAEELVPDSGPGNRFSQHVFPALRLGIAGQESSHPNLNDGYQVQLFTDAAAQSALRGEWVSLAEVDLASDAIVPAERSNRPR